MTALELPVGTGQGACPRCREGWVAADGEAITCLNCGYVKYADNPEEAPKRRPRGIRYLAHYEGPAPDMKGTLLVVWGIHQSRQTRAQLRADCPFCGDLMSEPYKSHTGNRSVRNERLYQCRGRHRVTIREDENGDLLWH